MPTATAIPVTLSAAFEAIHAMELAITAMAPVTLAGLTAKAAFVRATLVDYAPEPGDHLYRLGESPHENIGAMARKVAHG